MSIIIFLIILSVLVVAHELGHFWAARWSGMRVDEFGVGFPPRFKKLFHSKGTDFVLNWLPFGGYVKIHGENPDDSASMDTDSFASKSTTRKVLVLVAGVLANFLLAWVLFSIVLMIGIETNPDGFVQRGFFDAIYHGLLTTFKITWLTLLAIWDMFATLFRGAPDFSSVVGPIGLVGLVGKVQAMGISYLLYFTALISVNLAIINMIPIPALDGGRVLLTLFEKFRGRKLSTAVWNMLSLVSFAFLILLMVIITVRDVQHLL